MRVKLVSLCLIACSLIGATYGWAQDRPGDRIKSRLDEVREMADQERRMINLLEDQLAQAQTAENQDQIRRLSQEIADARARLQEFRKLESELEDLESTFKGPVAFRRNIRTVERSSSPPETPQGAGDVAAGRPPIMREPRPDVAPQMSSRLDNLRQALRHLEAAGEVELARRVQRLIQQEAATGNDDVRAIGPGGGAGAPPRRDAPSGGAPPRNVPPRGAAPRNDSGELSEMRSMLQQLKDEIAKLQGQMKDLKDK